MFSRQHAVACDSCPSLTHMHAHIGLYSHELFPSRTLCIVSPYASGVLPCMTTPPCHRLHLLQEHVLHNRISPTQSRQAMFSMLSQQSAKQLQEEVDQALQCICLCPLLQAADSKHGIANPFASQTEGKVKQSQLCKHRQAGAAMQPLLSTV